jgi:hypothetical protein
MAVSILADSRFFLAPEAKLAAGIQQAFNTLWDRQPVHAPV